MKKLSLLLLLGIFSLVAEAQNTRLKWNAAYWLVGITNISVETPLGAKLTLNGDVVYSPWESVDGNAFHFLQIIPELRYYPRGSFNGFYIGAYAAHHQFFKLTKWNYLNSGQYQKGNGFAFGATIGYQIQIDSRWSLDVYAGGGFQDSGYRGYIKESGNMYASWNRSAEWMPYKLGIAFAYKVGKPRETSLSVR